MIKNKSLKPNWTKNFPEPVYSSRFERNDYASGLIAKFFSDTKNILNIGGGGKRHLEESFNSKLKVKITEIDITGDNDLNLNLDLETKLPYEDNSFDMTLALDNLEHIENFHQIEKNLQKPIYQYPIFLGTPHILSNNEKNVCWKRYIIS